MKKLLLVAFTAAVLFAFEHAPAQEKPKSAGTAKTEMEAFMTRYLQLWNTHDAAAIVKSAYRLDPSHPWSTEAGLKAEFDRLRSQGYSKSEVSSVTACVLGADIGRVELRYVRLKADGTFMPPKDRASVYELKRFPDGWRATGMRGLAPDAKMDCPAS